MSKHTPGPWMLAESVEKKHFKTNLRRIRSEREGLEHGAVCEVYGIADGSEAHANARLIAAAPELLEFANSVVRYSGSNGDDYLADKARALIVKATGENK